VRDSVVAHHLRLFGVEDAALGNRVGPARLALLDRPDDKCVAAARHAAEAGTVVIALLPSAAFCEAFAVARQADPRPPPTVLWGAQQTGVGLRLRTLHPSLRLRHADATAIVLDDRREAAWLWLPIGSSGIVFIATDLAEDLVRYRQGDPAEAPRRPSDPVWGIPGARPRYLMSLYLFENQVAGESPYERHADWWAAALADVVSTVSDRPLRPLLPGNAPGAVVITGDDDQAYLEKYVEQLKLIGDAPITYFLHPQTRHTRETLRNMFGGRAIDLGIHPDALDIPDRYPELFREQAEWYQGVTGEGALSVRNHGFLNDGYWGHLSSWRRAGVRISSNLPCFYGGVVNGSLVPARVNYGGELTEHWSIATTLADSVRGVLGMDEDQSARCVFDAAQRIRESGVPGVLVFNLHPQNVAESLGMHRAALEVIASGFHPWTVRECLAWFEDRDATAVHRSRLQPPINLSRRQRLLRAIDLSRFMK
jgi:hypothetical protein